MRRTELNAYLIDFLNVNDYEDYAPNGLQVQGRNEIKKIVTGVTACQALLDKAVALKADAVMVHHGYFWKGEDPCVVSMKHSRLKTLLLNDINLFGFHLPLDGDAELGNNIQLARLLEINVTGDMDLKYGKGVGLVGELKKPMSGEAFASLLNERLNREPLHVAGADKEIRTLAWCSGGAPDCLIQAAELGVDAYFTGEVRENTFHEANELGLHFFAAGHHATERYGIKALGEHVAERFGVECVFVDIMNPV